MAFLRSICLTRALRSIVAALGGVFITAALGAALVYAYTVNPSYSGFQFWDNCQAVGESAIEQSEHGDSSTYTYAGACSALFHVHAYFWGSDSQYHYMEDTSGTIAIVIYSYWTNDIYGYHQYQYQQGYAYLTSHAY